MQILCQFLRLFKGGHRAESIGKEALFPDSLEHVKTQYGRRIFHSPQKAVLLQNGAILYRQSAVGHVAARKGIPHLAITAAQLRFISVYRILTGVFDHIGRCRLDLECFSIAEFKRTSVNGHAGPLRGQVDVAVRLAFHRIGQQPV